MSRGPWKGRDFLSILDLDREDALALLELADRVKRAPAEFSGALATKVAVLLFEKPSLRTRVTFEVGMTSLGGSAIYLARDQVGMGEREPACDVARNLDRWVHAIVARTYSHATIEELAREAEIPTINALSDREHPCEALADFQTIRECFGEEAVTLTYVGDGNNVCHSLLLLGGMLGYEVRVACPLGYEPAEDITREAERLAAESGGRIVVGHDPRELARGARVLYTDVWTSMGQEEETQRRRADFSGFQVNQGLLSLAAKGARVMHCLPAHRGEEISAEVMESPAAVLYDQAENRLHSQKALLLRILGGV
ncbi:MAG: ornithine carbamoyltransferase [Candidatus Omnitrophica bacterium]|nr:ornithine carbamoyltransferase [Candidatus Omnitrophota bacterium]